MAGQPGIFDKDTARKVLRLVKQIRPTPDNGDDLALNLDGGTWGMVWDTGPEGSEADYTDERYWIRRFQIASTASASANLALNAWDQDYGAEGDRGSPVIVTATHLSELSLNDDGTYLDGSHKLTKGTPVFLFQTLDGNTPPNAKWYFIVGSGGLKVDDAGTSVEDSCTEMNFNRPLHATAAGSGKVDVTLPTLTVTIVTDVTCNGDGTISITTADITTIDNS